MVISVSELNSYVKEFFDLNPMLNNVFVKGEISNFKHHSSGHLYMTLKDENAAVKAVMFKYSAMSLDFQPENGMKVIVNAKVSLYERDGAYQIYINEMQPDGVGALHIKYEQLKEKLEKEGLFEESNKKAIPHFPRAVGVITSKTGAAVRDIINVIKRRSKITNVYVYPATVQGEGAHKTIIDGIKFFNSNGIVDTIIIGRGGGSIEDLWAFNEEELARSIFASEIPIISAVGHETDFTISDFVADLRAPTPSAAAELCVPDLDGIKLNLSKMEDRLINALRNNVSIKKKTLDKIKESPVFISPHRLTYDKSQYLNILSDKIVDKYKSVIMNKKEEFIKNISKLDSLSPLKVLKRGYSFAQDENGKVVSSISKVEVGNNLKLKFSDGSLKCKVLEKGIENIYE